MGGLTLKKLQKHPDFSVSTTSSGDGSAYHLPTQTIYVKKLTSCYEIISATIVYRMALKHPTLLHSVWGPFLKHIGLKIE